jgi:hypothetical protein
MDIVRPILDVFTKFRSLVRDEARVLGIASLVYVCNEIGDEAENLVRVEAEELGSSSLLAACDLIRDKELPVCSNYFYN